MRFALLPAKQRRSKQSAREVFSLGRARWSRQAPFVDQRPRFHQRPKGQGHSYPGPGDERAFPVACTTWPSGGQEERRKMDSPTLLGRLVLTITWVDSILAVGLGLLLIPRGRPYAWLPPPQAHR